MILAGTALVAAAGGVWPMTVKAALCATFVLLTSPVGAHAICRGAYLSGVPLWSGSVEDAFAPRAEQIRRRRAEEGAAEDEKA